MCQMNTFVSANFENRAVDSARAKRWASNQIRPVNWARAKMATAMRAKDGLAIRVDAAHQRRSRATMVPIKTRTNRMLKDRAVLRLRHRYSANCVFGGHPQTRHIRERVFHGSSFMQRCCRGFGLRAERLLVTPSESLSSQSDREYRQLRRRSYKNIYAFLP